MEKDNYVVKAGIDTSESIVISHKIDIDNLKEENTYLKFDIMQQLMIGAEQLHESHRITISVLNKPKDFTDISNDRIDHVYCSTELAIQSISQFSIATDLSDYHVLVTFLEYLQLYNNTLTSPIKKTSFNIDLITQEKWNNFTSRSDQLLETSPIKDFDINCLQSKSNINFCWNIFQSIIITAAKKTISNK
ncbi:8879_t:CDS:2 [Funneliformis geosporum]|uniref:8879_t:CDS:1 n=1 Tax=Funneliformis geosporum TaxID=1117311 RepID=A0A9W4SYC0_9GLOM|nr:8879_t:CDS:2 [Funneliformis geosporum]